MRSDCEKLTPRESLRYPAALLLVGAAAVASVFTQKASAEKPSIKYAEPMAHVGYNTNKIWVEPENIAGALDEAESADASMAEIIRILVPVTTGGSNILNDWGRYCTALIATRVYGLKLRYGLDWYGPEGKIGYFPDRPGELNAARTKLYNMMSKLASGECKDASGQTFKADIVELDINEPNYAKRYRQSHMGIRVANALAYLVPRLGEDAKKLGINFSMGVTLASSEPNQPLAFIDELASQLDAIIPKDQKKPAVKFGINYYAGGQFSRENLGTKSRVVQVERIVQALREHFGQSVVLEISEAGAFSDTAPTIENQYDKPVPPTIEIFPGRKQGEFYRKLATAAACLKMSGFLIFHKSDDSGDVLRTGDTNPDGTPKPSAPIVRQTFADATAGRLEC